MITREWQHAALAVTCQALMLLLRLLGGGQLGSIAVLPLHTHTFTFTTRLPLRPMPLLAGVCMQYMLATGWSVWPMVSFSGGLVFRVASCRCNHLSRLRTDRMVQRVEISQGTAA